jgi:hypothetical protein
VQVQEKDEEEDQENPLGFHGALDRDRTPTSPVPPVLIPVLPTGAQSAQRSLARPA